VVGSRFLFRQELFALLFALALSLSALSQTTPTQSPGETPRTAPQVREVLPTYEGQTVSSVELAGRPDLNIAALQPLLAQKAGQPFSEEKISESIRALKATGKFNNVQLQVRPEATGVRVLFVLQPALYFGVYEFPGATQRFSYSRLLQVTNYPPRGEYSHIDVENAQNDLESFYRRNGYFLATVEPRLKLDPQHGIVNVIFYTGLNKRAKFGNVEIEGPTPQETERLKSALRTFWAWLRRSDIREGKTYNLKVIQNATQYLQNTLAKQEKLAAVVRLIGANYNPASNRADIKFHVETGPSIRIKVVGARPCTTIQHLTFLCNQEKKKLLPVYAQAGVDPELIQEGRQNLVAFFQSEGYFDAQVTSRVQQQPGSETILYQVSKGPRHKVDSVTVKGNKSYSEKALLSHVTVKKGSWFSHGTFSTKAVNASAKNLENLYKANGFSDVSVTPQVTNRNGNLVINFQVNEGRRDVVQALNLKGNNTVPESVLAPKGLKLGAGKPYSQTLADIDRNQILAEYLRLGYLTATVRETATRPSKNSHQLDVTYDVLEGPKVQVATIVTEGRDVTKQKLIDLETKQLKAGEPLKENDLLSAESQLYQPGVFDWAEIDPRREITTQDQEDVLIKVHEAKRNEMTYGFGFQVINRGGSVPSGTVALPNLPPVGLPSSFKTSQKTFWGPEGTFEYTRNNLRGKAESLTFSAFGGRLDQRLGVTYTDPFFNWSSWTSSINLLGEHNSENPIFTSRQGQAGWQFQKPLDDMKTQNLTLRYNFSETGLTHLLIPALVPTQDLHVRLSTFSASYTRDTRDDPLNAHKGIYESFEVDMNPGILSSVDFGRLLAQSAYYKQFPKLDNIVFANSVRLGAEQAMAGSHIPLSEEFFSGGGSTLRGFSLNGAGPQRKIPACGTPGDPSTCAFIQVPVGGNQLVILNSELRTPLPWDLPVVHNNLEVVPFYDGGNVYRTVGFHNFWGNYTNTVGLGLRYVTPVGPIRIDYGELLNAPPGIPHHQIFVTLGQAF
jgi:outer membrane protein assembly factor BamA